MPSVLSPRDLVSRSDNMDENVLHMEIKITCGRVSVLYKTFMQE